MKATCSRCNKRKEILFEYEVITIDGLRELKLCNSCTKWTLNFVMSPPLFESVFNRTIEISQFLKDKSKQAKLASGTVRTDHIANQGSTKAVPQHQPESLPTKTTTQEPVTKPSPITEALDREAKMHECDRTETPF